MSEEIQELEAVEEIDVAEDTVDEPVVEAVEPEQAPEWSEDDAAEAKVFGWKSLDEWQGDVPEGYIDDPRRYLERAEKFRPFKALKDQMEASERTAAERLRKLEAMTDQSMRQLKTQHERELASIKAQKREAVETADVERFDALDKQERELTPPPSAPASTGDDREQVIRSYTESENGAWAKNPILRDAGAKLVDAALRTGITFSSPQDQFAYAEGEIRKMYPAYFPAAEKAEPKPKPAQRVDAGGLAGGAGKGSAFTKLPPEAKGAFKKFVGEGLFKDNEEDRKRYADDYNAA